MKFHTLFILSFLLCSATAFANDNKPLTIVISPTLSEESQIQTPVSLSVVTPDDIEASGATTLTEVLRSQAGIQIKDNIGDGSRASISLRGFGANSVNNVLIVVDGRKLNNPTLEAPLLSSISLKDIERIEILQGSGGVLYGDQAVGGVVNIITKKFQQNELFYEYAAGSHDLERNKVSFSYNLVEGLNTRFSAEKRQADNYRENNEADYTNVFHEISYDSSWGTLYYERTYIDDQLNLPGFLTNEQIADDPQQASPFSLDSFFNNEINIHRLGAVVYLSKNIRIDGNYSYRDTNGEINSFGPSEQDTRLETFNTKLLGDWATDKGKVNIVLGYEKIESEYQKTGFSPNDWDNQQESIYGQLNYPLLNSVQATVGIRYTESTDSNNIDGLAPETSKNKDDATATEVGLNYRPSENNRLFLRRAESFRFANADENGSTLVDVNFLSPQESVSYETGYEFSTQKSRLNILLYQLDISDEIYFDSTAGFFCCNINLEESRRRGLIVEFDKKISKGFSLGGSYSYTDAVYTSGSFEGNRVANVPRDMAVAYFSLDVDKNLQLYMDAVYTGRRFPASNEANDATELGGYTITNFNVGWNWNKLELDFRINNLGNKQYSSFLFSSGGYPSPERTFELSLKYRIL